MSLASAKVLLSPTNEALRFLPEGPYPFGNNRFSWVAIQHGADTKSGSINVYDFSTNTNKRTDLHGRPGFAFGTTEGNFVVGCEREVGILNPATKEWRPFVTGVDAHTSGTIINDGVTWDGNLIFGTKDLEFKTKKAGLYFWRASDRKLFQLRDDQICSNGKCVIPLDENHIELLDIDSPTRRVVSYRVNLVEGRIESEKTVVDLASDEAVPDGMTITPNGKSVIISLYNPNPAKSGRTIQVSLLTGATEMTWESLGSPQATCPQWVERDGKACIVITTAVEHMPSNRRSDSSEAGSLFIVETNLDWETGGFAAITPMFVE